MSTAAGCDVETESFQFFFCSVVRIHRTLVPWIFCRWLGWEMQCQKAFVGNFSFCRGFSMYTLVVLMGVFVANASSCSPMWITALLKYYRISPPIYALHGNCIHFHHSVEYNYGQQKHNLLFAKSPKPTYSVLTNMITSWKTVCSKFLFLDLTVISVER